MLNRFMLIVSLFVVPTMEAKAGQLDRPNGSAISKEIAVSGPYNVRDLDPELSQALQKQGKSSDNMALTGGNWWNGSGPGPYPVYGGYYYEGTKMSGYTPPGAIMQTVQYYWSNTHLNGWNSQITVLLWFTDGNTAYYADVTSQNSATLNVSGVPANYKISFWMKVGTLQVALSNPPYIDYGSANVYYTY